MGGTYVLHWPLFSAAPAARYLAALVPLAATAYFGLVGAGLLTNERLVAGVTRSGRRAELLGEPLAYGAAHSALAALLWRASPAGPIAVAVLCFGDAAAELVGRRAAARLPYNRRKTWAGSAACFLAGLAASLAYAFHFRALGLLARPVAAADLAAACALAAAAGAAAESLPLPLGAGGDNLLVPAAAAATAVAVLGL